MAKVYVEESYKLVVDGLSNEELVILKEMVEVDSEYEKEQQLADDINIACKRALKLIEEIDELDVDSAVLEEAEKIVKGRRTKRS